MRPRSKILIVDDSDLVLSWVKDALEAEGYQVVTQSQALGCGAVMIGERPDLLLVDLSMPTLSGAELVQLVRNNDLLKHTVVVLHSAKPATELRSIVQSCGADGFIEKTDEPKELARAVKAFLARPRQSEGKSSVVADPSPQFTPSSWTPETKRRTTTLPRPLFVDDEARVLMAYKRMFSGHMDADFASSADEALTRMFSDDPPDVVVCDVLMPDKNGLDLYRKAIERDSSWRHRFVFVSGGAFDGTGAGLLAQVEVPVLNKPVNAQVLSNVIRGLRGSDT